MNRKYNSGIIIVAILLAFRGAVGSAADREIKFDTLAGDGVVWLGFTATVQQLGEGSHPNVGWDIYHGDRKLLWVGTGWKRKDSDARSQWGLWDARNDRASFKQKLNLKQPARLIVQIAPGGARPGDESVHLWIDPPTASEPAVAQAAASLRSLSLNGLDRAVFYAGSGSRCEVSDPVVGKSFADVVQTPKQGDRLFVRNIQPLFAAKCIACHGAKPGDIKGAFDLTSRSGLMKGGESGASAVDLKHPEKSILLKAVQWKDGWEMPPKENDRLTAEQIGWIRDWITAGAPWPQSPSVPPPPEDIAWGKPDADGNVMVKTSGGTSQEWTHRRYEVDDLWAFMPIKDIALPPAQDGREQPHPIDAFIAKKLSAAGIEPAPPADRRMWNRRATFGLTGLPPTERQLRETNSARLIDGLLESPHYGERMAQHWLDVVRYADSNGFSRDDFRPEAHRYRTYVIESFNADKPYDRFVREQIAGDELAIAGQEALSFLWVGPWEHTAMSVKAVTRQLWLDDVTNSVGVTFLAQQLRCASCHDHKFDPIPTRDYYSLQAVFASTKHDEKAGVFKIQSQQAAPVRILAGGSLESPGVQVGTGALSVLAATARHPFADSPRPKRAKPRAKLARWIADRNNPLTARVFVNRVWQMHFGRGLVSTPNDFGKMGARPTHPELLDWLARWFMDHGWSVKKLHRLIATSDAYRRGSSHPEWKRVAERDPANQLLSHFPARRLGAEEVRDSMLLIAGELNPKVGGPSVYPEINWEVAFQPRLLMGKIAPPYEPSPRRADRNRRSIYAVRIRNLGHPFMEVLNRPSSEMSCDRRNETTVTPQAFTLLHGEFVHERALALANRVAVGKAERPAQVASVYAAVLGRKPTDKELSRAIAHVQEMTALHRRHKLRPKPLPTSVTLENVAERTGEPQKKTFALKKLAEYEEDLKPWQVDEQTRALADLCLVLFNSSEFLYVY